LEVQNAIDIDQPLLVTMPWGATSNYGHFVLDCLPAVATLSRLPGLADHVFAFPPLLQWHRRHLQLLGLTEWVELPESLIRAPEVLTMTTMNHYLHGPGIATLQVPRIQLARAIRHPPEQVQYAKRLYVTRPKGDKRTFVNESQLIDALIPYGFEVVEPATWDVQAQLLMFSRAEVIVGSTGAAFSNALYCQPGCQVVEIQTQLLQGVWVRNLCQLMGMQYRAYFTQAVHPGQAPIVGGVQRPEVGQEFSVDVKDLVSFLGSSS
jgi:capsular polysaccharide biosynthesis protein